MQPNGVNLSGEFPLAWQARESFAGAELADWMRGNVVLLQAMATFDTLANYGEREHRTDHHLAHVEAKLDLALTLIGELLRRQTQLPPALPVVLTATSLAWRSPQTPAPHAKGVVTLYLSPHLPWPLMLPVEVSASHDGETRARIVHLSEEAQDWLDRTLFRHHRRAVHARPK